MEKPIIRVGADDHVRCLFTQLPTENRSICLGSFVVRTARQYTSSAMIEDSVLGIAGLVPFRDPVYDGVRAFGDLTGVRPWLIDSISSLSVAGGGLPEQTLYYVFVMVLIRWERMLSLLSIIVVSVAATTEPS